MVDDTTRDQGESKVFGGGAAIEVGVLFDSRISCIRDMLPS